MVNVDLAHGSSGSASASSQGSTGDMFLFVNRVANNERGGTTIAELSTWCRAVTGQGGLLELQAPERLLNPAASTTWYYRMTDTTFCELSAGFISDAQDYCAEGNCGQLCSRPLFHLQRLSLVRRWITRTIVYVSF